MMFFQCREKWKKMPKLSVASAQESSSSAAEVMQQNTAQTSDNSLVQSTHDVVPHPSISYEDSAATSSSYHVFSLDGNNKKTRQSRKRKTASNKPNTQPLAAQVSPPNVQFATSDMLMPPIRKRSTNPKHTKTSTANPPKTKRTKASPKEPGVQPDSRSNNPSAGMPIADTVKDDLQQTASGSTAPVSDGPSSVAQKSRPRAVPLRRSQRLKDDQTS
jgi:hypothetical protein